MRSPLLLSLLLALAFAVKAEAAPEETPTFRYVQSNAGTSAAKRYTGLIETSARRWHLDPLLVARVIRLESSFQPREVSNVGALGLMQVMPFHFTRRGIPRKKRMDPPVNIDLGCRLLAWYRQEMAFLYKGLDPRALNQRTLVAYNMGMRAVASRGIYRSRYSDIILTHYHGPDTHPLSAAASSSAPAALARAIAAPPEPTGGTATDSADAVLLEGRNVVRPVTMTAPTYDLPVPEALRALR